jgi:hypothetical protein
MVKYARHLAGLSDEVYREYKADLGLKPSDFKKLELIEKLAKKVLTGAGGALCARPGTDG